MKHSGRHGDRIDKPHADEPDGWPLAKLAATEPLQSGNLWAADQAIIVGEVWIYRCVNMTAAMTMIIATKSKTMRTVHSA
jgi:hypothetical protein